MSAFLVQLLMARLNFSENGDRDAVAKGEGCLEIIDVRFGPGLAWVCVHRIPPQIRTSAPLPRGFFLTKTSSHALWGAATSCGRRAKLREGWLRSGIGIPSSSDQPALVLIIAGINSPH